MPTDPNIALLFAAAGLLGIYGEFCFPGTVIPGAAGGVLFLLSVAGFVEMGARLSAAIFLLAGFVFLAAEAWFHTRWILAIAGTALIVVGAVRLHQHMHPWLATAVSMPLALLTVFLFFIAVRASENKKHKEGVVFWHSDDIFSSVRNTHLGKKEITLGRDS